MADILQTLAPVAGGVAGGMLGGPAGIGLGMQAGSTLGGLFGGSGDKERDKQKETLQQYLDYINGIKVPTAEELEFNPELAQLVGQYTPQTEQLQTLTQDRLAGLQADPELQQKQRDQIELLSNIAKEGMSPAEAAAQRSLMRQLEGQSQSKIADIQREEAQRGVSSSGAGMLAKMIAQQQAQNQASQSADQLMAQMFQNKLNASGQASDLASQLEQTQYGRELGKAQNKQAIDEFNTRMAADVGQRNVAAQNLGQQYNLNRGQKVADTNVDLRNAAGLRRADMPSTLYDMNLKKGTAMSPGMTNMANFYGGEATRQTGMDAAKGNLAGLAGAGIAQFLNKPGKKDNTGVFNPADFSNTAAHGALVEGDEVVKGDSTLNDTEPYMLSAGEAVIPKSIMENPNAGILSKHYIEGLLKKHKEQGVK